MPFGEFHASDVGSEDGVYLFERILLCCNEKKSQQRIAGGGETSMVLARDHSGQAALHWVADPSLVASAQFEEQVMPMGMRFDLT